MCGYSNDIEYIKGKTLGYLTQKPLGLMDRIIEASSNTTDIVLNPMCGCGTALDSAHRLSRRWFGIDISPTGCNLMKKD